MTLLIIDTASTLSAVGLFEGKTCLQFDTNPLSKSPAEYLMDQISTTMEKANKSFSDIDRIIVNKGPGSFTGIRIGIAAARGFGLALNKPVIGISLLEAKAFALCDHDHDIVIVEEGHGGTLMAQRFDSQAMALAQAYTATNDDISQTIDHEVIVSGSGAALITNPLAIMRQSPHYFEILRALAQLGAQKLIDNSAPSPIYMRPPDAKPQTNFALPRI